MQEASRELYSTEEKQAGETEKQEYKPLKITGNEKGKVDTKLFTNRQNRKEQIKPLQRVDNRVV